jgi:hypothetical protein
VFYELASVFCNSLLPLVSTPKTVGKVSAFGWSMGYFGGIVLLGHRDGLVRSPRRPAGAQAGDRHLAIGMSGCAILLFEDTAA